MMQWLGDATATEDLAYLQRLQYDGGSFTNTKDAHDRRPPFENRFIPMLDYGININLGIPGR